jgi:KDO2-lipid IV(A) lauroyltransferase
MWKYSVFAKNLRLTKPFFEKAGAKQPKYDKVAKNLLCDAFDFVFRHPKQGSLPPILEEMKQGGIFLTAHYGNHELLGFRLAESGLPLNSASQEQKPKFFDAWLQKKRTFNGKCFAKKIAPEYLIDFIDGGGLFALLADQDFRKPPPLSIKEECESTFLGVEVRCNPLPAFILKHRPQTPVFCGYLGQIKKIPSENFYAHYHLWLENLILENPSKWYGWFHNRFSLSL